jgi:hypothetical protein
MSGVTGATIYFKLAYRRHPSDNKKMEAQSLGFPSEGG